jgi:hypothetical protein
MNNNLAAIIKHGCVTHTVVVSMRRLLFISSKSFLLLILTNTSP